MTIESQSDIVALQRIGRIVSLILHKMLDSIEPGKGVSIAIVSERCGR